MEVQEILSRVRRIEIKTKGLSKQLFSGAYHSSFKGRGMSFSEVREYASGDDVRHIDWNVTARTGQPFVKVYEEERELTIMLMVDISDSTFFGSGDYQKSEYITELAAVLAFSASQNQDKVGLILFSDKVELYMPPKKGRQHISRIIRELLVRRPGVRKSGLVQPLRFLYGVMHKKAICFVCSDFQYEVPEPTLRIVAKRHELIGFQILDPLEYAWPPLGILPFRDSETGEQLLVDTSDPSWMKEMRNNQDRHIASVRSKFLRAHADFLQIDMTSSYTSSLIQFFKRRAL